MTGLIVALDSPDLDESEALARQLAGRVAAFKVGLTLFLGHGPEAVRQIGAHGPIFCDLKLHDIPHQVGLAASQLTELGVWMFTVHASGGSAMVAAAARAASAAANPPLVAAVTVLTSLDRDELALLGVEAEPEDQVLRLARRSVEAGATALVCSANEVERLRRELAGQTVLVTPGIRPAGSDAGDQARVMTPAHAAAAGSNYIVVGRPITGAPDPVVAAEKITAELAG
ncbi:MAG TPA: orotidine-5'-phosphate decarboxylase [Actinomycetota bacterium]|nr:orotidine-5'-phosphate decarboxylase [Actinomycetota bacterium]